MGSFFARTISESTNQFSHRFSPPSARALALAQGEAIGDVRSLYHLHSLAIRAGRNVDWYGRLRARKMKTPARVNVHLRFVIGPQIKVCWGRTDQSMGPKKVFWIWLQNTLPGPFGAGIPHPPSSPRCDRPDFVFGWSLEAVGIPSECANASQNLGYRWAWGQGLKPEASLRVFQGRWTPES